MLLSTMGAGAEAYYKSMMLPEEVIKVLAKVMEILLLAVFLYIVYRIIEKLVYRFLPEKQAVVLITRNHKNQTGVRIRVKNVETGKSRVVFMPNADYEMQYAEGAKGTLYYKGRYGTRFVPEKPQEQNNKDKYYRYKS